MMHLSASLLPIRCLFLIIFFIFWDLTKEGLCQRTNQHCKRSGGGVQCIYHFGASACTSCRIFHLPMYCSFWMFVVLDMSLRSSVHEDFTVVSMSAQKKSNPHNISKAVELGN